MGVDLEPWQVINSGQAAAYLLHARFPQGGPVYIVGEEGLARSLVEQGFYAADKNVLAVVAGLDRKINYDKLDVAARFIRDGAIYIGTNPDATFPSPGGVTPGAGVILAALQTASGITPIIAGKPERAMFDLALSRLGTSPQETLAIGDRLETDTAGAQRVGCRAALVLSGVTGKAAAEAWTPRPDLIALDLTTLLG
jgi:4-nitrophenyl phosphatase